MRGEAIFAPMSALALWTVGVLLLTGYRRIGAVANRRVGRNAFLLGESSDVPADVSVANRNLMNLLEMPTLFYVVCIALFVTGRVTPALVVMAWVFVGLRVVHSTIHLTSNRVLQRMVVFTASNVVLAMLWGCFIARIVGRSGGRS